MPLAVWGSSIGLGVWSSFILYCVLADIAGLAVLVAQLLDFADFGGIDRESWIRSALGFAFIASIAGSLIGLVQAIYGPVVRKVRVPLASLPDALIGLRIVQISDLHIGTIIRRSYMERVARKVMALSPDIIALTGDMADGQPEALRAQTEPLAKLAAPLGSYYITGNHEYYSGAEGWIEEASRLGFMPLLNANRVISYRDTKIMVAGVTDIGAHHFMPEHKSDPRKAAQSDTECDVRILLAHQPESCFAAEPEGFHLQLSGHTHAGQYFPFGLLVWVFKRYAKGLYKHKSMWVYVNAGTGFWGPANRFCIPAEITLLELTR